MMLLNNLLKSLSHAFVVVLCACFFVGANTTSVLADSTQECAIQSAILSDWDSYAGNTATSCNPQNLNVNQWCENYWENYEMLCRAIARECLPQGDCAVGGGCAGGAQSCSTSADCPLNYTCSSSGCCVYSGGSGEQTCTSHAQCTDPSKPFCNPHTMTCMYEPSASMCPSSDHVFELISETDVNNYAYVYPTNPQFAYALNRCHLASCWCGDTTGVGNGAAGNAWIDVVGWMPAGLENNSNCISTGQQKYYVLERCSQNSGCSYGWTMSLTGIRSCNQCQSGYTRHLLSDVMTMSNGVDYRPGEAQTGFEDFVNILRTSSHGLLDEDGFYVCVECIEPGWKSVSGQPYEKFEGNKCAGNSTVVRYRCNAGYMGNVAVANSVSALTCTACPAGTYQPNPGSTTCETCPGFSYGNGTQAGSTNPTGATDITSCFVNCGSASSPAYTDTNGSYYLSGCSSNRCYYTN